MLASTDLNKLEIQLDSIMHVASIIGLVGQEAIWPDNLNERMQLLYIGLHTAADKNDKSTKNFEPLVAKDITKKTKEGFYEELIPLIRMIQDRQSPVIPFVKGDTHISYITDFILSIPTEKFGKSVADSKLGEEFCNTINGTALATICAKIEKRGYRKLEIGEMFTRYIEEWLASLSEKDKPRLGYPPEYIVVAQKEEEIINKDTELAEYRGANKHLQHQLDIQKAIVTTLTNVMIQQGRK